jgi:N-acetylmuramoyl-L-alanine amidase
MQSESEFDLKKERPMRINLFHQLWVVFGVGIVLATFFTAWTPYGLVPLGLKQQLEGIFTPPDTSIAGLPTPTARPLPRIGIVVGHYKNDTGAVCPDGLQEVEINLDIATRVKERLVGEGYDVDLLAEFDDRLYGYMALALVSIHADSCEFINNDASGFKVSPTLATSRPDKANRLVTCLINRYQNITGLNYHAGSVTPDMSSYHAFDEIHSDTAAAIIETGFMNLDRQILTEHPDLIAKGVAEGILCYIRNEDASLPPSTAP